jgi:hypothetical protein
VVNICISVFLDHVAWNSFSAMSSRAHAPRLQDILQCQSAMLYHDYVWSFTWLHLVFHLSRIAMCNQYEPGLCLCAVQMDVHLFNWHLNMLRCFGHVFQQTRPQNMATHQHYYLLWFDVLLVIWLCIHDLWSMMTPITYMWQSNGSARALHNRHAPLFSQRCWDSWVKLLGDHTP